MKERLFSLWLNHPWLDLLAPAATLSAWWFGFGHPIAGETPTSTALVALSASSGIVLAVAALAVGMLYQSRNPLTVQSRAQYGNALRRSFTWIFLVLLFGALVPILGTVLQGEMAVYAAAIALAVGSITALVLLRVLAMLRLVMKVEHAGEDHARPRGQSGEYRSPRR